MGSPVAAETMRPRRRNDSSSALALPGAAAVGEGSGVAGGSGVAAGPADAGVEAGAGGAAGGAGMAACATAASGAPGGLRAPPRHATSATASRIPATSTPTPIRFIAAASRSA
jgi:hypothetical protein